MGRKSADRSKLAATAGQHSTLWTWAATGTAGSRQFLAAQSCPAKSLKAEMYDDLIEQYLGTVSLPFALGKERTIALTVTDDRGIESLRVMEVG